MATTQPKSGVTEYTTTTGTGPVTLTGAATGYRGWVSADDGKVFHYAIRQAGTTFEVGVGTYDHDSRQLTRTTIRANKDGTTSPLNLGAGTKEVSIVLPAELTAMLDSVGEWAADQHWNGYRQYLDADQDSWIDCATDDVLKAYLAAIQVLEFSGGAGSFTLIGSDDTAGEGPELNLRRDSASPSVSDFLGVVNIKGRDSSGAVQAAFRLRSSWTAVTAGAHASVASFSIAKAGALQAVLSMIPDAIVLPSGINMYSAGKSTPSAAAVGAEIRASGVIVAVADDVIPLYAYRNTTRGVHVACGLNGTYEGGLINNSGTISVDGASLSHRAEWAPGYEAPESEDGFWVVSTMEGLVEDGAQRHPLVRLSSSEAEVTVYGVTSGRLITPNGSQLQIEATGAGRIRVKGEIARGDLLMTSDTPGVACRQADDVIRSCTIAKATQSSPDNGSVRVVACTLLAG